MTATMFALVVMARCATPGTPDSWRGDAAVPVDAGQVADAGLGPDAGSCAVRVATFNVHRLFDTQCESGRCGTGEYEELATVEGLRARAAILATAITGLDADVIALQEVETQESLDAVTAALDGGYAVAVLGEIDSPASVDVAVLARGTLVDVRRHRHEPLIRADGQTTTFSRELLEVAVTVDGRPVVMFAAHFRSQFNDDPERRLLEARQARLDVMQAAQSSPASLVVLAGDLNDVPDSPPLQALLDDGGLERAGAEQLPGSLWTYAYAGAPDGGRMALDHILHAPSSAGRYLPFSARAFHDGTRGGWGGSDHAALVADYACE